MKLPIASVSSSPSGGTAPAKKLPFEIAKDQLAGIADDAQKLLQRQVAEMYPTHTDLSVKKYNDHALEFLANAIRDSLPDALTTYSELETLARNVLQQVHTAGSKERNNNSGLRREKLSPNVFKKVRRLVRETYAIIREDILNAAPIAESGTSAKVSQINHYNPASQYRPEPVSFAGTLSNISPKSGDMPRHLYHTGEKGMPEKLDCKRVEQPVATIVAPASVPISSQGAKTSALSNSPSPKALPCPLDGRKFEPYVSGLIDFIIRSISKSSETARDSFEPVAEDLYNKLHNLLLVSAQAGGKATNNAMKYKVFHESTELVRLQVKARRMIKRSLSDLSQTPVTDYRVPDNLLADVQNHLKEIYEDVRVQIAEHDSQALRVVPDKISAKSKGKESISTINALVRVVQTGIEKNMSEDPDFLTKSLIPYIVGIMKGMKPQTRAKCRQTMKISMQDKQKIIAVYVILIAIRKQSPDTVKVQTSLDIMNFVSKINVTCDQVRAWAQRIPAVDIYNEQVMRDSGIPTESSR